MINTSVERYLWAIVIVAVGGLMLAQNLNIIDQNVWDHVWRFWPLFMIIPGISAITKGKYFWGIALTVAGFAFIYSNYTNIDLWGVIWSGLIISFGISLVFKPSFKKGRDTVNASSEDILTETALFSGVEKKVHTKNFKGGSIEAIFGGGEIDLRNIELGADYVVLDVTAIFGGVEVLVNTDNYKVIANGTGIFGGWTNKFSSSKKDKPVLEIKGEAIFGGVEIK